MKIYYDKETHMICDRYPGDNPHKEDSPFIEVSEEEVEPTYYCQLGYAWVVEEGKLAYVRHETEESKALDRTNELNELKQYLSNTDYVISKLNELQMEDEEVYNKERKKYEDILSKRRDCRKKINELENEGGN